MSLVHIGSRFWSLSEVSFLGSRKINLGANVSRWIAELFPGQLFHVTEIRDHFVLREIWRISLLCSSQ